MSAVTGCLGYVHTQDTHSTLDADANAKKRQHDDDDTAQPFFYLKVPYYAHFEIFVFSSCSLA